MADPSAIATQFVEYYYKTFDTDRSQLANLYRDHSMLTFETGNFAGAANIGKHLQDLPFGKVVHVVKTIDAQPSDPRNPSLLVLVTGELQIDDDSNTLRFSQAFNLVQENNSFFVLNDIFRLNYG